MVDTAWTNGIPSFRPHNDSPHHEVILPTVRSHFGYTVEPFHPHDLQMFINGYRKKNMQSDAHLIKICPPVGHLLSLSYMPLTRSTVVTFWALPFPDWLQRISLTHTGGCCCLPWKCYSRMHRVTQFAKNQIKLWVCLKKYNNNDNKNMKGVILLICEMWDSNTIHWYHSIVCSLTEKQNWGCLHFGMKYYYA